MERFGWTPMKRNPVAAFVADHIDAIVCVVVAVMAMTGLFLRG